MSGALQTLGWPLERLPEAVAFLSRRAGLRPRAVEVPVGPAPGTDPGRQVEAVAELLGLEAEEVLTRGEKADALLCRVGPGLWWVPSERAPGHLLLVLRGAGRTVRVLGPDHLEHRLSASQAQALLRAEAVGRGAETERLLAASALPSRQQARAKAALDELLDIAPLGRCWVLRHAPDAPFWRQARQAGVHRGLVLLLGSHALQYALWLLSWWVMGRGAFSGHFDPGWMVTWALLLLSMLPLRMLSTWSASALSVDIGALLKKRLLAGALHLAPEEVRHQGAGHLLGRVLDAEQVESLATTGGALAVVGLLEVILTTGVLGSGAGGAPHVLLLCATVAILGLSAWRYYVDRERFSVQRSQMANGLVERLLGHRTRRVQQAPERWHQGEEHELLEYLGLSQAMDRSAIFIQTAIPRLWLILSFAVLGPGFVSGDSPERLAVGIGGTLLVYQALRKLTPGLTQLTGAAVAWRQTRQLFEAAGRVERPTTLAAAEDRPPATSPGGPLVEGHGLAFRHAGRSTPILDGCSLEIRAGERLLLEGPSGSGKTTLGSLLAGLRQPQSGLLLLQGMDRRTLGPAWRKAVSAAPQFHENHVFNATLAFNLLMGRRWPPSPADLEQAVEVCRGLGLGPLLARMPQGIHQPVGETGWPLSHGEKSRLYIARTILQGAQLLVLDESFAALDAETLKTTLDEVIRRTPTLLVIAHP